VSTFDELLARLSEDGQVDEQNVADAWKSDGLQSIRFVPGASVPKRPKPGPCDTPPQVRSPPEVLYVAGGRLPDPGLDVLRIEQYCHDLGDDLAAFRREGDRAIEAATNMFGQQEERFSGLTARLEQIGRRLDRLENVTAQTDRAVALTTRTPSRWDSWYFRLVFGFVVLSATPVVLLVGTVLALRLAGFPPPS
jgi:hypothetical protein